MFFMEFVSQVYKALILLLFLASFVSAATFVVNGTVLGNACFTTGVTSYHASIQAGVNAASAGDTIIVCQNTTAYYENVNISKSLNIYGNESFVIVNASDSKYPIFNISASGVNVTNFTFVNASIDNNDLGSGIYVKANNVNITYNNFSGNHHAIYFTGSDYGLVADNIIANGSGTNIRFQSSSDYNLVRNNTINCTSPSTRGVRILSSQNNTIDGNTVRGCADIGIYLSTNSGSNNSIINNILINNSDGISIENNDYTFVQNNSISGGSDFSEDGIEIVSSQYAIISNNTITGSSASDNAINLGSTNITSALIVNNTIYNFLASNAAGIKVFATPAVPNGNNNFTLNNITQTRIAFNLSTSGSNTRVFSNNITNATAFGVYISNSSVNTYIYDNTINGNNAGTGLTIDMNPDMLAAATIEIINNSISNFTTGALIYANRTNFSYNTVNYTSTGVFVGNSTVLSNAPVNTSIKYNNFFYNNFSINVNASNFTNVSLNTINNTLNGSAIYINRWAINASVENNSIYRTNITQCNCFPAVGQFSQYPTAAIVVNASANARIVRNVIIDSFGTSNGLAVYSNYSTIQSNVIVDVANYSIYTENSFDSILSGNNLTRVSRGDTGFGLQNVQRLAFNSNNVTSLDNALIVSDVNSSNFSSSIFVNAYNASKWFNSYNNSLSHLNLSSATFHFVLNNSNATLFNNSANYSNVSFSSGNTYSNFSVIHPLNVTVFANTTATPFDGSVSKVAVTVSNSSGTQLFYTTSLNSTGSVLFNVTTYVIFSTSSSFNNLNYSPYTITASASGYDTGSGSKDMQPGSFDGIKQFNLTLSSTVPRVIPPDTGAGDAGSGENEGDTGSDNDGAKGGSSDGGDTGDGGAVDDGTDVDDGGAGKDDVVDSDAPPNFELPIPLSALAIILIIIMLILLALKGKVF